MRLAKRLLESETAQAVVAVVAALGIRFVFHTNRWDWRGFETVDRLIAAGRPFVFCFWHGRLFLMSCIKRGTASDRARDGWMRYAVLISGHRDGRLIARTIAHFSVGTLVGSSSRGNRESIGVCLAALSRGVSVGVTPDGPRGPRMRAAPGAVQIARRAGVPIVPVTYATTRRRILSSWDRFQIPLPFGRGVFLIGDAFEVPRNGGGATLEWARLELETRLNALTVEADRLTGHEPIAPAAESGGSDPSGLAPASPAAGEEAPLPACE